MNNSKLSAFVVVDLQIDFCPGGALAVNGGDEIVSGINNLISGDAAEFDKIVLTADWHPEGHISFASSHGYEPFTRKVVEGERLTLWPDHCVGGSIGAGFHPDLIAENADLILRKGRSTNIDSYSVFFENDRITPTGLKGYLSCHGIEKVYLCGLAFDWCVYYSAMDSVKSNFKTFVIKDLTRSIDLPTGYALEKEKEMKNAGIGIIDSLYF